MLAVLQPARKSHKGQAMGGKKRNFHLCIYEAGEFICLVNCKGSWSGTTLSCKAVDMIKLKTDRGSLNTIESKR